MKIAYFVQLNMEAETGVYKKIISQSSEWMSQGNDVKIFISTKLQSLRSQPNSLTSAEIIVDHYNSSMPAPADGRLNSIRRIYDSLKVWKPDVVYTRQDIYYPIIGKILKSFPTVVEINTDDLGEMKDVNSLFLAYYKMTRNNLLANASGLLYVSHEIAARPHYAKFTQPKAVIGNSISLQEYDISPVPYNTKPRLVFIGHAGQRWHGLDKIIELSKIKDDWDFDIIGTLKPDFANDIGGNIKFWGKLKKSEYINIFNSADIAIGSLALHRNSMDEASPLKVREYLACGIPTIIGYNDTDFPDQRDFLLQIPNEENSIQSSILQIDQFVAHWRNKRIEREKIENIDVGSKESVRTEFMKSMVRSGNHK